MKREINIFFLFYFITCLLIFLRLEIVFGSDVRAPFTDDFYYYLTTSRNLINLSLISFDQISITNGFQPLWFLILTLLKFIFKNDLLFNTSVIFLIFILSLLTFFNFKLYLQTLNYSKKENIFISASISFLSLFFSKNGMEISLSIYFFSLSLKYFQKNIILFCIFAYLTFLSRLEFIIFYFVILADEVFLKKKIFKIDYFLRLLLLPLLIILYLYFNYIYFGFPFPESGIAKSITNEIKFNKETFIFLQSSSMGMRFISMLFYINILGLLFIFTNKLSKFTKYSLITNIIFFSSNSLRSAWPLWTWHFFFLSISTPFILNDLFNLLKIHKFKYLTTTVGIFFVISYAHLTIKNYGINNDHMLNVAKQISNYYSNSKYEKFAMGDMAGKVSYLLNKKLVQLEGLVGGNIIIDNIKKEENLCKVLNELGIEIYLTSKVNKINNSYIVYEPSQKSENVKKMKGILKIEPEIIFNSGGLYIYAFNIKSDNYCDKIN